MILIGNELLSGRTQDLNLAYVAKGLAALGIRLLEARVIPDIPDVIVTTVNECRARASYVFTTGGIGPTHDDITTECVARAFEVPVVRHPDAEKLLIAHYPPEKLNADRLRMADVPEGAELIPNPVSAAPGYRIGNVYIMAGVPRIMQAMFDHVKTHLTPGDPIQSLSLTFEGGEGDIATPLRIIQEAHPGVDIGSYPHFQYGKVSTTLVVRSADPEANARAMADIRALIASRFPIAEEP